MPRKRARSSTRLQEPELREVGAEQSVRVAAHRILGDAERRAEHARLGQVIRLVGREGEHEIAGRAELRRQRREARQVGLEVLERLRRRAPRSAAACRATPTMRSGMRVSRLSEASASASSTARRSRSFSSRPSGGGLRRIAMLRSAPLPRTSMSTMPALDFCRCQRGASCRRDSTYCAATVACPTKPASLRGREEARAHAVVVARRGRG